MVFDQRHAATQLTVEVRDRTPDVVTVGISGELDRETCATAERVITELLRTERPRCVALDMSEVTFMGADGIHVLLICRQSAEQLNCRLGISRAHERVRRVLTMVCLDDVLTLATDGLKPLTRR